MSWEVEAALLFLHKAQQWLCVCSQVLGRLLCGCVMSLYELLLFLMDWELWSFGSKKYMCWSQIFTSRDCLWGHSMEGEMASLLDRLNRGLNGDSRSGRVGLWQVKKENVSDFITGDWSPSYLFISRSHILLGPMIKFPGYKYQRPDHCKGYQIQTFLSPATNLRSTSKSRCRQDL